MSNINIDAAHDFVSTHARLLDRRRFGLLLDGGDPAGVLAALDGYRNPDGGYGWGLEPDLRARESQPASALHAFEVFAEIAPAVTPRAEELCDWLSTVALPDGGLPFALPIGDRAGCAPWWADADPSVSALQITAIVAANAHRVARHDRAVGDHPWLAGATRYCAEAIRNLDGTPHAFVLAFAAQFLDAAGDAIDDVSELQERVARHLPPDGVMAVEGGTEDEVLRALDISPVPGRMRDVFDAEVITAELRRLEQEQQVDGGWPWEPRTFSPASALEWRGYVTVRAVWLLQNNPATGG